MSANEEAGDAFAVGNAQTTRKRDAMIPAETRLDAACMLRASLVNLREQGRTILEHAS